jgi:DNA-damage-inducible protein J
MRTTTTNLSIRMNVETKKEAEAMFDSLGMSLTTAINIFIKQSLRTRGIPFQITMDTPNAVTLAAMEEARQLANDPNAKTYANVEDALAELKK